MPCKREIENNEIAQFFLLIAMSHQLALALNSMLHSQVIPFWAVH
jgi:hypothetical protein